MLKHFILRKEMSNQDTQRLTFLSVIKREGNKYHTYKHVIELARVVIGSFTFWLKATLANNVTCNQDPYTSKHITCL